MAFPTSVDAIVDAPPITAATVIHASQVLGPQRITVGPVWLNVKSDQFGAAGDGVTDDTAAINAAITAAGAAGTTIFFPPGTYICSGALTLGGSTGIILQGSGGRSGGAATASILRYTPSTGARFIDGRASAGLCIRDLFIQANNAAFGGILVDLGPNGTQAPPSENPNCQLVCQES